MVHPAQKNMPETYGLDVKDLSSLFSSLFGAFFGALAAYLFTVRYEKKKEIAAQHDSSIRLQMTLIFLYNFLCNVRDQHLNEYRDDPNRAFKLVQFYVAPPDLKVNYESISFLMVGDTAQLVHDIYLAEQDCRNVVDTLAARNDKLEEIYSKPNTQVGPTDMQSGLTKIQVSAYDQKIAKDLTDALYECCDRVILKFEDVMPKVRLALKSKMPKRKFLNYEYPSDDGT
jgi:hypothetical protein